MLAVCSLEEEESLQVSEPVINKLTVAMDHTRTGYLPMYKNAPNDSMLTIMLYRDAHANGAKEAQIPPFRIMDSF